MVVAGDVLRDLVARLQKTNGSQEQAAEAGEVFHSLRHRVRNVAARLIGR
jgi:hypothetical protein